ncbi:MAG: HDOD domain-containing protein [Clostridium sp.]|jgi:EAL and modified HD-GYP domain-containing signal transduction protein|nr:HDOD domain-containing protein [Clostridium sp.]
MLITLIPLFDENLTVSAYSLFTQKKNLLLNPSLLGTGRNDGAMRIPGLEVIQTMGIETLSGEKEVFVEINNISVFSDIADQCRVACNRIVLLIDSSVAPEEMYASRLKELKKQGYKLAIRKLAVQNFEKYKEILRLMDYILLDHKKIDISKAKIYFTKVYPKIKLVASNIQTKEIFESLKQEGGYQLYEGEFFRVPITEGQNEVAPLKANYIQLLNLVNSGNFELTQAAAVIGQDTALVISLLKMVNRMARNSEITSIRHAAAMLGQKELKRWINTAVANELYADKPNEITRVSLIRAKFAETLAPAFGLALQAPELFLMGLFSVLDVILERPMKEALEIVQVSKDIQEALTEKSGKYAPVLEFITQYEAADWQEVSRLMIVKNIEMSVVYDAYVQALQWYKDLFYGN